MASDYQVANLFISYFSSVFVDPRVISETDLLPYTYKFYLHPLNHDQITVVTDDGIATMTA